MEQQLSAGFSLDAVGGQELAGLQQRLRLKVKVREEKLQAKIAELETALEKGGGGKGGGEGGGGEGDGGGASGAGSGGGSSGGGGGDAGVRAALAELTASVGQLRKETSEIAGSVGQLAATNKEQVGMLRRAGVGGGASWSTFAALLLALAAVLVQLGWLRVA